MEKERKLLLTLIIIIALIYALTNFSSWITKTTGYTIKEPCYPLEKIIFYFTENCNDCIKQTEIMPSSTKIEKINCKDNKECANFEKLPAWKIDGKIQYGIKSEKEINKMINC